MWPSLWGVLPRGELTFCIFLIKTSAIIRRGWSLYCGKMQILLNKDKMLGNQCSQVMKNTKYIWLLCILAGCRVAPRFSHVPLPKRFLTKKNSVIIYSKPFFYSIFQFNFLFNFIQNSLNILFCVTYRFGITWS